MGLLELLILWVLALPAFVQTDGVWLDVPFFDQQENGCGASSLAMVMQYWEEAGSVSDPEHIYSVLYSRELGGIPASQLKQYLEENGFKAFVFKGELSDLKQHLLKGRPLIVCLKHDSSLHYVVVTGINWRENLVLLNDPAGKKLSQMEESEFERRWGSAGNWTLLPLPGSAD
jgi:ABC-type bacteriocin/lantibiotic exporter with double-glycine peptidase domain